MAKNGSIRWRDSDVEKLRASAERFNRKVTQLAQALPDSADFLPPTVSVDQLQRMISTRKDFNKQMNYLDGFIESTFKPALNPQGILTLSWYIDQLNKMNDANNKRMAQMQKELHEADVVVSDVDTRKGWEVDTGMGDDLSARSFNFSNIKKKDFARRAAMIVRRYYDSYWERRAEGYMDTYIIALYRNLPNFADQIVAIIQNIDPLSFWHSYAKNNEFLQITYQYEPQAEAQKAHQIMAHWRKVLDPEF